MDEHRIGLKPLLHNVWCFDGQRPLAPVQHRYEWRYLVGFVHPASGRTVFHLATSVSIPLFEAELAAFAQRSALHRASRSCWSWIVPAGTAPSACACLTTSTCSSCQPYSPELQPAEHLWPLTNTALVNRYFASIEEVEDVQAERCVALQEQPDLVRSTTRFSWWPQRLR